MSEPSSLRTRRLVALCILDGWGDRAEADGNAVAQARTPNFDALRARWPQGQLSASGLDVGLPDGQMGNSEVGHTNLGAGRVVMQILPRIDSAVADGSLADNPALQQVITKTKTGTGRVHVLGLLSPGGVHAHQVHFVTAVQALEAAGLEVIIHAIGDGRDTPPRSLDGYLQTFEAATGRQPDSLIGRYFAMDRDNRAERTQAAFDLYVNSAGETVSSLRDAVAQQYAADVTDEFLPAFRTPGFQPLADGDGLFVVNFRADRVRQILDALLLPDFALFDASARPALSAVGAMTPYSSALAPHLEVLFPPEPLTDVTGEVVAAAGLTQLRAAETEKYPHVTYFFNGGLEEPLPGEDRLMIPSPKVATYDLQPEMSAPELIAALLERMDATAPDLLVVNFANPDMVGHTGDLAAAVKAVETVDAALGQLADHMLDRSGALLVIADHGNCEVMTDPETGRSHTAHTINPVPVIAVGAEGVIRPGGRLGDVAPTLLHLLGVPQPDAMTGQNLLEAS